MKKFGKKRWILIFCLIVSIAITLTAIGFIPVKRAVYADKDDERRYTKYGEERALGYWFNKEKADNKRIVEAVIFDDRAMLKRSGTSYIGEHGEYYNVPVYYEVRENSPLSWLNANFNPDKVKNYFAIRYWSINGDEAIKIKDGYREREIVITDWTPTYPIQRSGWLASRILPKDYLVIWDFIGPRAVSE